MSQHIVIIGNGIAGVTAARFIRKGSEHRITVISGETDHFFARTALMYVYMGHMKREHLYPYEERFWRDNRIDLRRARVESIDTAAARLRLVGGDTMPYDRLVIATGSQPMRLGRQGEDLEGVQGLYSMPDLERMEANTRGVDHAVVVGGGLIGVEVAEMLQSRGIGVTFLVREQSWMDHVFPAEESAMLDRHVRSRGVDLRLGTELERILPDGAGRVRAVVTRNGEQIPCGFVAIAIGVTPSIGFIATSAIACDRGVLVDDLLATSAPNVYAIGDCAQLRSPRADRRAIEALWYVGRRMGETVARTLCGEPTPYDPGVWFNSAKFFDLEYQVYGTITPALPHGHATLLWQHPSAERSIRITYRDDGDGSGPVRGFNLLGVRYRHELCDEWVREERDIRFALENLGAANFDPELSPQHEAELAALYNARHPGRPVRPPRRRGLRSLLWARAEARS